MSRAPQMVQVPVYPRVCGGSGRMRLSSAPARGLSPRVRGKPDGHHDAALSVRSIPACAGEAASVVEAAVGGGVYPRVCGGSRFYGNP